MIQNKQKILIQVDYCLTPTNRINNATIVVEGDKIIALGGASAFTHPEGYQLITMPGCYATPGFIDTHLYGAGGVDFMHVDTEGNIEMMSRVLAEHGVSSFLPTTHSDHHDHLVTVISCLSSYCHTELTGAIPVGIHVEGPFISMYKRGSHSKKYIRPIDIGETEELIKAGNGQLKILTFAPELDNVDKLIAYLCKHDIIPSMGHTMADRESVLRAIGAGAKRCSHIYNGMESLQQRKVGLAAIALIDDRLWVELIPDGIHIHPGMIDLTCRSKAKDKLICISNSTEAAGLKEGIYKLGEDAIVVEGGRSTLADGTTLAGSVNFLDQNYRSLLSFTQLTQEEALACCSLNPALSIKLNDRGQLKPGKRADILIMDSKHTVQLTMVGGKIVYNRNKDTMNGIMIA